MATNTQQTTKTSTQQNDVSQQTAFTAASEYIADCVNAVSEGLGLTEKSASDKATHAAHKVSGQQTTPERLGDAASDAATSMGFKEKTKTEEATDKAVEAKEAVQGTAEDIESAAAVEAPQHQQPLSSSSKPAEDEASSVEAAYDYVAECVTAVGEGLGLTEKSTADKVNGAKHKLTGQQTTPERLGDAASDAAVSLGLKEESKTDKALDKALDAKEAIKETANSAKDVLRDAKDSMKEKLSAKEEE